MSQVLEINQKQYYPSSAIASDFGYSVDYVSKLVREGKVAGERVGRQWYADREAFSHYVTQAQLQKELRKEELSAERKRELVVAKVEREQTEAPAVPSPLYAFGQATAVMACVVCVTALSYAVYTTKLKTDDFQAGVSAIGADLVLALTPVSTAPDSQVALLGWLKAWLFGADNIVMSESTTAPSTTADSLATPTTNGLVLLDGEADEAAIEAVRAQFSDPVEVEFEGEDTGVITPIFKDRTGESYRFVIVPVTQ